MRNNAAGCLLSKLLVSYIFLLFQYYVLGQETPGGVDIGLMKNPCLHPDSYRLARAVYIKELDENILGEAIVFCGREDAEFPLVHKLSGGDLDGDDFLVVT